MTFQEAQRKARFGHRDWITWRGRDGAFNVARSAPDIVKAALLAVGTKGRFTLIAASTGTPISCGWSYGIGLLRNSRAGCA
jgi:hypothetical protein